MTLDLRWPAPLNHPRISDPNSAEESQAMIGDLYQSPLRYGGAYEESSVDGITPRPHWAGLMESLQSIGPN